MDTATIPYIERLTLEELLNEELICSSEAPHDCMERATYASVSRCQPTKIVLWCLSRYLKYKGMPGIACADCGSKECYRTWRIREL